MDGAPTSGSSSPRLGTPPRKDAAWARPLLLIDQKWSSWETRLCTVVLVLEVAALTLWVALKGISTPPDGAKAGLVFRALTGATVLGSIGYFALGKYGALARRVGSTVGVVLGLVLARSWAHVGVDWSANLLNWYQQASTLALFGGLRGVGTQLTLLLALLGGSLATASGRHITIDLLNRFLKPSARLPVTLVGWFGASIVCFGAAWGFLDHIAIEDFDAKADATVGRKISTIGRGIGENWFILRKQIRLDSKSLPHVLRGEPYADWLNGSEWNAWLDDAGFVGRYGEEKVAPLRIPDDARRAPIVVVPEKGETRGALGEAANLVFPIGLLIIALRFVLLGLLAIAGHKSIETETHLDLGTRPREAGETNELAR